MSAAVVNNGRSKIFTAKILALKTVLRQNFGTVYCNF